MAGFNLFDFSGMQPPANPFLASLQEKQQQEGDSNVPPTQPQQAPLPVTQPIASTTTQQTSTQPDVIQNFLDTSKSDTTMAGKRNAVIQMLQDGLPASEIEGNIQKMGEGSAPIEQPKGILGTLGEEASNAYSSIKEGASKIGDAGAGLANGKYNLAEAGMRGAEGALQVAFSPVTGIISEGVKTAVDALPTETKQAITNFVSPKVEAVNQWYDSQTPEQKRNLDNIGVGLDVLSNFVGLKAAKEIAPEVLQTGKTLAETAIKPITNAVEGVVPKLQQKYIAETANAWKAPIEEVKGFTKAQVVASNAASFSHDIPQELANNGITIADNVKGGLYDTLDTAESLRIQAGKKAADELGPALKAADASGTVPKINVEDIRQALENEKLTGTPDAVKAQKAKIDSQLVGLSEKYPDGMSLSDLNNEKITFSKESGYNPIGNVDDNIKATANRAITDALRTSLEESAPSNIPIKAFNKELQKGYQMADYLEALHGKKVPQGVASKLANGVAKVIGAKVGTVFGGGPLGGIMGYHLGGLVEKGLENLNNPIKGAIMNGVKPIETEVTKGVKAAASIPKKVGVTLKPQPTKISNTISEATKPSTPPTLRTTSTGKMTLKPKGVTIKTAQ